MVDMKNPSELEEVSEIFKMEDTIHDMLDKVMEEDDSLDSFDLIQDDINEESLKISRISTRHQTSDFQIKNKFNRPNKRNLTEVSNNSEQFSSFNSTFCSINSPTLKNTSFCFQNNLNNNIVYPNFFQNSKSSTNDQLGLNNNSITSLPSSISFNHQIVGNPNFNKTYSRNPVSYSKTVAYNGQKNVFKNVFSNSNFLFNSNNFVNKNSIQNIINENSNMHNTFFSLNSDSGSIKRKDNRKKTYDVPITLQNSINNYLKNNKNINNNSLQNYSLANNSDTKNNDKQYKDKNNYPVKDIFIYQLKIILDKNGNIDYNIYNLIKGQFLSVIKNHKGSKLFQKYLKSSTPEEIIHLLYIELSQNLEEFITDPYSNYFCKKFFLFLNSNDRIEFLKKIENSIFKLSCHSIGTYPIQTIIENLSSLSEKFIIIKALKSHIEELSYDPFGCHVLEKLLSCFDEEFIYFIYSYISDNFIKLAYNNNGICLVKKILTFTKKINLHEKIKKIVKENPFGLVQHPYGNFVIQVIVEYWNDYKEIINIYKGNFFALSLEKFASNVIERFIERDEEILNEYIDEIINTNRIYDIMESNFGNYVIQKAIKLSKNGHKNKLVFCAAKDINNLKDGKLIIKWKSILLPHIKELTSEQIQILKEQKYFEY